jgi:ABC-2 type transport system ATP-binding protein
LFLAIPAQAGTHFDMGTGLRRCGETGQQAGMTEEVVIRAQGLTKRYGGTVAVDHIDLDVRAGEIVGILGPNGSGKTTTILMLLGLTEPSEGRAEVAGFDPLRDPLEVKRRVGYLPDSVGFYDGLSARDNLAYTARLAGLSRREIDQRFTEALARVGLPDVGRDRVATFSRGMRQRLGLAEVLMKRPSIAILDEPTATLDPHSTQEFLGMIRGLKADGTAVLLSSHHLDQVQSVCDRVALFNRGRIALSGSVTELAQRVLGGGHVIDVEARGGDAVRNQLAAMPGVVRVQVLAPDLYRVDCEGDLRAEIARRLAPSFDLLGIRFAEPSLNEVYTRYFDEVRDAA